jgi:xylan 1,4-beta-xylosidase
MRVDDATAQARQRWASLMGAGGAQDRVAGEVVAADLPAPTGLTAHEGRSQVTLTWDPVPGAIGYAIHRAPSADGPYAVVDHGGGDVLAVPCWRSRIRRTPTPPANRAANTGTP